MSRAALPPVPNVEGTPATYSDATFARVWPERRETWVERSHPAPVQRAYEVGADERCVPSNARRAATYAATYGWNVRITHAVGYAFDSKTGGIKMKDVYELTGEYTEKGTARKKKVGEIPSDPVDSLRVVIRTPDYLISGHWVEGRWDTGLILSGHTVVRNVDWTRLWEALNVEGAKNVRGETPGQQELPL